MECFFTDHGDRFSFEERVRLVVNLQTSVRKYLSKNESVMLACLLGGAQSRERLMSAIWFDRGVVVTNASYYQLIAQLRKSFEEVGLPKDAIKTIPRFGLELAVRREIAADVPPSNASEAPVSEPAHVVPPEVDAAAQQESVQVTEDPQVPHRSVPDVLAAPSEGRGFLTFLRGCYRALIQEAGPRLR